MAIALKVDRFEKVAMQAHGLYLQANAPDAPLSKAILLAQAMQEFRQAFDDQILDVIMPMMNQPFGFLTDKDPKKPTKRNPNPQPYPREVIRDCCMQACLKGVQYVNNQFNIIAGNCYITRNGWEYLIKKLPGFKWWKPEQGVPVSKNGGIIVPCSCSWKINQTAGELTAEIPVKTDEFIGVDGMLGKAARKFYKRVFEAMTGVVVHEQPEPNNDENTFENEAPQGGKDPKVPVEESDVRSAGKKENNQDLENRDQSGSGDDLFHEQRGDHDSVQRRGDARVSHGA